MIVSPGNSVLGQFCHFNLLDWDLSQSRKYTICENRSNWCINTLTPYLINYSYNLFLHPSFSIPISLIYLITFTLFIVFYSNSAWLSVCSFPPHCSIRFSDTTLCLFESALSLAGNQLFGNLNKKICPFRNLSQQHWAVSWECQYYH